MATCLIQSLISGNLGDRFDYNVIATCNLHYTKLIWQVHLFFNYKLKNLGGPIRLQCDCYKQSVLYNIHLARANFVL
jgi:hypothetical protein